ncbi:MAG: acylphosphatase [Verrucomicrobia bacterium]|nr:acylphosphatase [Verrucomicrobiota bacterium]MBS0646712.1 acylphosphatase [Verrucomicrobiota bacterium]
MIELQAVFKGTVQGVGFRRTVWLHANQTQIVGTVRNLDNGDVEMVALGEREQLESLLSSICEHPGSARIEKVSVTWGVFQKNFNDFQILM